MARIGTITAIVLILLARLGAVQDHRQHAGAPPEKLGTVVFRTSCAAAAQPPFTRAVALLHSFEFASAIEGFGAALAADPSCAMAEWGIALSRWGNPFAAGVKPAPQLQLGRAAVERAVRLGAKTERERAYLDAVGRLFADFEHVAQATRFVAYRDAMAKIAAAYPDDTEATIFYAVSLAAAAPPTDKTYADQLKAGAILEKLWATQPEHPGLAHYIIHAYDLPPLAPRASEAARRYAKVAPSAPHALHMPSHTFTRLGLWQESIDANIASSAAAKSARSTAEELHAMDYLTYAYLQTGQDRAAKHLLDALPEVAARFDPDAIGSAAPGSAGVFALAAIPARYVLERARWAEAAKLEPRPSRFPYAEAMTYFARALGAARTGDPATAKAAIDALPQIRDRLTQAQEGYWAEQVEIERLGAAAWLALAEGRPIDALALMRSAAAHEDATEKNAVTPGPLAPGGELLGEMLLELKQPRAALEQFETTLRKEPNRFRTVYGAARASALAGIGAKARAYYRQLVSMCARADAPVRPELSEAQKFLAGDRLRKH